MSFSMVVSGDNAEELRNELLRCAALLGGSATCDPATAEKRKPGRPAKAETAAPAPAPAPAEVETPVESADDMAAALGLTEAPAPAPTEVKAPVYTVEQVKAALQELSKPRTGDQDAKAGLKRVVAVMEKIGVKMVKDIPAEKFADVIRLAQS